MFETCTHIVPDSTRLKTANYCSIEALTYSKHKCEPTTFPTSSAVDSLEDSQAFEGPPPATEIHQEDFYKVDIFNIFIPYA